MSEGKTGWQRLRDYGGFVFGFVGFIWWFGVTPEMVSQFVYDIGYAALPFVMLGSGFAIGWFLRRRVVDANAAVESAVEAERQRGKTERLRIMQEQEDARKRAEDNAKADRFTTAQLGLMLGILRASEHGPGFFTRIRDDNDVIAWQLSDMKVVVQCGEAYAEHVWTLEPEWHAWVLNHVDGIEERLSDAQVEDIEF